MNYSSRSRFSALFWPVCGCLLLLFSLWLYANLQVQKYRHRIVEELSKCLHQAVSVGNLDFLPPNAISLRNISIRRESGISRTSFFISGMRINFSLPDILGKKAFTITRVSVNKFKIIQLDKPDFDPKQAGGTAGNLLTGYGWVTSGEKFDLFLHNGSFIFPEKQGRLFQFNVEKFTLRRKGQLVSGKGGFGYFAAEEPGKQVSYAFSGQLGDSALDLYNLELKGNAFYAKLWGNISPGSAQLRGFSFLGKSSDQPILSDPNNRVISRAQKIISHLRGSRTRIIWVSSFADWNLLDLDCRLKFSSGRIGVERCSFSLNHIPVSVTGAVYLEDPLRLELKGAVFSSLQNRTKPAGAGDFSLRIAKSGLTGQAKLAARSRGLRVNFKNLLPVFLPDSKIRVSLKQADVTFYQGRVSYNAILNNLESVLIVKEKGGSIAFKSRFNEGSLSGVGALDLSKSPLRLKFKLSASGINPHTLGGYLAPYSGNAGAAIRLNSYPGFSIEGKARVLQGNIAGDKFFEAIADFLGLPEIREIGFQEASSDFTLKNRILYLTLTRFKSAKLGLKAAIRLNSRGFVSGKITLGVPVALLGRSEKFKPLLKLLDSGEGNLDFDFQLAGLAESPNFKWLESDFKKRLRKLLPGFMERGLERSVDEAIGAISREKK